MTRVGTEEGPGWPSLARVWTFSGLAEPQKCVSNGRMHFIYTPKCTERKKKRNAFRPTTLLLSLPMMSPRQLVCVSFTELQTNILGSAGSAHQQSRAQRAAWHQRCPLRPVPVVKAEPWFWSRGQVTFSADAGECFDSRLSGAHSFQIC